MKNLFLSTIFLVIAFASNAQIDNSKLQQDFVKELNAYRASKGLGTVKLDSSCINIAKYQSTYCSKNKVLIHNTPAKQDLLAKLPYSIFAENAHSSFSVNALTVLNSWIKSPGHNYNLLLSDVKKIGIYAAFDSTSNIHYVFLVLTD